MKTKLLKLNTAEQFASHKPRVLVLGDFPGANRIADELQEEGFIPEVLEEKKLPAIGDPNAREKLKTVFQEFRERSQGKSEKESRLFVHPGLSFWADRSEIVHVCSEVGLQSISPSAKALSLFSNKLNLLSEVERLGIPNLVLSFDPVQSVREVEKIVYRGGEGSSKAERKIGGKFPVVLRSVFSMGGKGNSITIHDPSELEKLLPLWLEQLRRFLGEAIIFPEHYVEGARHISLTFCRLIDGQIKFFSPIDSSLRRAGRKLVELCPAESVDDSTYQRMMEWSSEIASSLNYVGLGVFDYIVDGNRIYFFDAKPSLDSNFPLWENVDQTMAVSWQIFSINGESSSVDLASSLPRKKKTAVLSHLFAEKPYSGIPAPGYVVDTSGPRKWETPFSSAEFVPSVTGQSQIDCLGSGNLGFLLSMAQTSRAAIDFSRECLKDVWFSGAIQTNEKFIDDLLSHSWIRNGIFHSTFVDEEFIPRISPDSDLLEVVRRLCRFISPPKGGEESSWMICDRVWSLDVEAPDWVEGPHFWIHEGMKGVSGVVQFVRLEGSDKKEVLRKRVCVFPISKNRWSIRVGNEFLVALKLGSLSDSGKVRSKDEFYLYAQTTGKIHSILYRDGAQVPKGKPILIIESLRELVPHSIPFECKILEFKVKAERKVSSGEVLAKFLLESK